MIREPLVKKFRSGFADFLNIGVRGILETISETFIIILC